MKEYTKKQIVESIKHWQNVLDRMDEELRVSDDDSLRCVVPVELVANGGKNVFRGFITVGDTIEAIENCYGHQTNSVLNYGPDGKIYGQVNSAKLDQRKCVMTLAPYKNGSRSYDASLECKDAPLTFRQLLPMLKKMPKDAVVDIHMKDPFGMGPNAGKVVSKPVDRIDIDPTYGVFMRTDNTFTADANEGELDESEDVASRDSGILLCSTRDMIFEDAKKLGNDVELHAIEFPPTRGFPIQMTDDEENAVKSYYAKCYDGFRAIAYVYTGKSHIDMKWANADLDIDSEAAYNEYVDPQSSYWQNDREMYDADFAKQFTSYQMWLDYKTKGAIADFSKILKSAGSICYEFAADNIKVDPSGNVYTIIVWRA